jgi:Fur family ferric uptake transcriptional regulator
MDRRDTGWRTRLRAGGYRVTPQRQLVLEAVAALDHATPESILAQVQLTSTAVNLSTVYRSLEVLEEVGLVTHAHLGHGSPAYHSVDEAPHIHLVCSGCGMVLSVPAEVAEPFAALLETRTGFRADIAHVTVQGLCGACRGTAP